MKSALVLFMCITLFSCHKDKTQDPTHFIEGFKIGSFEDAKIDKQPILELEKAITAGQHNVHGIIIIRDHKLIYEHYFTGDDAVFPIPIGIIPHNRDSLHDCRSVTKSIVSACIGIAIEQGKIKSINDNIFDYLPDYKMHAVGDKAALTIKNLLTMTAGLDWKENVPYTDSTNDEIQMSKQADVIDYILRKNSVALPGMQWNYNGGCTQLLAQIIKNATGSAINDFATNNLFRHLGIPKVNWFVRDANTVWAPSGLRMRPIDMAKFGQLYLQKGVWKEKQLIPQSWVQQALKWQINTSSPMEGYGYQFWCTKPVIAGKVTDVIMAVGSGGQRICMLPALNLQIIITAGNYAKGGSTSDSLLKTVFFPAIKE